MKNFKLKKIFFILTFFTIIFCPLFVKAADNHIIGDKIITTDLGGGITKISFQSSCTNYTTIMPNGQAGKQNFQNIYFNKNGTGVRNTIWFQHGDGSCSFPNGRLKCEKGGYFDSTVVLNNAKGKNLILLCPEMNPSGPDACKPLWSYNYDKFFGCLYNDFLAAVAKVPGLQFSKDIVFASHSQGGPATSRITLNQPSNIKVVGIIRFDSCYGEQCDKESSIPVDRRGPMITYSSDVACKPPEIDPKTGKSKLPFCNSRSNQEATWKQNIGNKPEVATYNLPNKDHGAVTPLCKTDFLDNNKCNQVAVPKGGTLSKGILSSGSSGGAAVSGPSSGGEDSSESGSASSISVAGGSVLGGIYDVDETQIMLRKPALQIKIPGLSFSDIKKVIENGRTYLYIPFLGEYIAAVYRYVVVIVSIFAIAMIIIAGFNISMSGGNSEKVTQAKKRIVQSVTGLVLAISSYLILYIINPNLVTFQNLKVEMVKGQKTSWEGNEYGDPTNADSIPAPSGPITDLSQIPTSKDPAMCGKNMAVIAQAYANVTPQKIGLEACSCAWFTSTVILNSGCDSSFFHASAGSLRDLLMNKKGWKEIPLNSAAPGDVLFYWNEDKTRITHATVYYKTEKNKYYIIDANTDFRACWTKEQRELADKNCGGDVDYKKSKDNKWGLSNGGDDYQKCLANLGICPMLEGYRPDLCGQMSLTKNRTPNRATKASEACYTRQCIKSQALTDKGIKNGLYSVLQNPLK